MSKGWTEERRLAQAERCRQNRPWEKSTGPKTAAGKARSAMNGYKHGRYSVVFPELKMALALNEAFVNHSMRSLELLTMGEKRAKNEMIKRHINQ